MKRAAAVVAGIGVAVPMAARAAWRHQTRQLEQRILQSAGHDDDAFSAARLADVPAPVHQYLTRTLRNGQRPVRTARITQVGEFQLNRRWCTMRAHQLFSATPPGFIWDARIYAAPLLPVLVRDSYVGGRGSIRASMLGLYSVANQTGAPELDAGALMRYLGEAAWFPTRLLPGHGLSWAPVDERTATATLVDGTTRVSLQFRFDEQGDLIELYSPDRFRDANGTYVPTPWRVRAVGHAVFDGIRLMTPSVAEWLMPEGPLPYWRGRLTTVEYAY